MKQITYIIALMAIIMLGSCKKTNEPEAQKVTNEKFIGTYDITIDYELICESEEDEPQYGTWQGTMTITPDGDKNVTVTSNIELRKGAFLDLYNTKGTIDSDGKLVLDNNDYTVEASGLVFHFSYDKITYADPLRFNSTYSTFYDNLTSNYKAANVAKKR